MFRNVGGKRPRGVNSRYVGRPARMVNCPLVIIYRSESTDIRTGCKYGQKESTLSKNQGRFSVLVAQLLSPTLGLWPHDQTHPLLADLPIILRACPYHPETRQICKGIVLPETKSMSINTRTLSTTAHQPHRSRTLVFPPF
jgi:hypothetical protein